MFDPEYVANDNQPYFSLIINYFLLLIINFSLLTPYFSLPPSYFALKKKPRPFGGRDKSFVRSLIQLVFRNRILNSTRDEPGSDNFFFGWCDYRILDFGFLVSRITWTFRFFRKIGQTTPIKLFVSILR
jgi:hypothetical protein